MHHTIDHHFLDVPPTRITRTSFLIRGMLLLVAGSLGSLLISASEHVGFLAKIVCVTGGASVLLLAFIAMFRSLLMPRLRDIGLHPAWSLLILVNALSGVFLLALLLIPANAFAKRSRYIL